MKLIGKGNTADVYAYETDKVCKLFNEGFSVNAIELEYRNAKQMMELHLPVPKVYELITLEGRKAIIYERLYGESLLDMLLKRADMDHTMQLFANLHRKIINRQAGPVMSYKEFLYGLLGKRTEVNELLFQKISVLPEGNNLCHGDYHPGNVWMNPDGSVMVIDFLNICYGPWQYDVARTYFLITEGGIPEDTPDKEEFKRLQQMVGNLYLSYMEVPYEDISEFVDLIRECRKYEWGFH